MRPRLCLAVVLSLLFLSFPVISSAGGPITSGSTVAGTLSGPSYLESWTFTGSVNQRVVVSAVTTSGAVNTSIAVKAPGGAVIVNSSADRIEAALTLNGTYTIEITDAGLDDAGTYALGFVNVTAGPYSGGGELDGGAITSSNVYSGTTSGPSDIDAWTFTGTNGDRVLIDAVATSGVGYNTTLYLYPPGGGSYATLTGGDRLDFQLTATGTWVLLIEDNGNDTPGTYQMSLLNVTAGPHENGSDTDGEVIASNGIYAGTLQQGVDFDAYTFSGNAGDRLIVVSLATGVGSHNPYLSVYPPGGGVASGASSTDRFEVQLTQSGTQTLVIEDYGDDDTGTYSFAIYNVTSGPLTSVGDLDGGPIVSADVKTGTTSVLDVDGWTFSGTNGDRVLIDAVATSGVGYNTTLYLYPPGGGSYATLTGGDRLDFQLTATGTWVLLIEDNGNDTAGSYDMSFLNVTAGPHENGSDTDGEVIASNGIYSGTLQQGVDFDAYTFGGNAGDRLVVVSLATGVGSHNPYLSVYPPGGGVASGASSTDRFEVQLTQSGTQTLVIEDYGDDDTGTYSFAIYNVTSGPLTSGGDLDGGPIVSADVKTGTTSVLDVDGWTFSGTNGDRVLIDAVATSGVGYNTTLYLYPPGGGSYATLTGGDRLDFQLTATGTWTLLIEDSGNDTPGTYALSFMNVTAGPRSDGSDPDGSFILSNQIKTGTLQQGVDFDAFLFTTSSANERIVLVSLATGAGSHNPTVSVYPIGGGPTIGGSSADRFEVKAVTPGTYVAVVEDTGNDDPGAYTLAIMLVNKGPFTGSGDTGGTLLSDQIVAGAIDAPGDIDAYRFLANSGTRVVVGAVATSGVGFNTTIYLYPPNGDSYSTVTGGDVVELKTTMSGMWTILVEDNGDDTPGDYSVSYLNITDGAYTSGSDPNGGPISDNVTVNGSMSGVVDFDGYTFFGIAGQTLDITCTTTAGALNTTTTVYSPFGDAALASTSADHYTVGLSVNGVYTVVVEDASLTNTGNYSLTVDIQGTPTGIDDTPSFRTLALLPAAPSPFSSTTQMVFQLPNAGRVRMDIYDVTGARIRSLTNQDYGAGQHSVRWDGIDDRGRRVASGVYYVTMQTAGETRHQKLVLVR